MKNNYIYTAIIALSVVFSSCEKTIDIAIEEQGDLIVLNGLLKAGEFPSIQLYQSKFIFDRGESLPLRDAVVSIYENDEYLGVLEHSTAGRYLNEAITIKPSNEYTIEVVHSRLQDVEATVEIPAVLSEENIQIENNVIQVSENGYNYFRSELNLILNDQKESSDYYLISLLSVTKDYNKEYGEDTIVNHYVEYGLETDDPTIENIYINYNDYFGLRDNLFNGSNYKGKFSYYNDLSPRIIEDEYSYYEITYQFKIDHCNEALYQYYIRLEDNRYPEAFTEPAQVYSNVENGYGILGASSAIKIDIE